MSTPCHACNGQTTQALKEIITLIGDREFVSQVKHTVCQNCGCNWVEDEDWKRADILAALSSFRSRHTFGGSSLYSVRHILGLTRDQLSGILGLPVKTLYDMEEGLTEITQSVFNAVEALVLKALPQPAPKPSALSLSIPISCGVQPIALTMKGHEELECCAHEGDLCEPQKREKEAPVVEVSQDYVIHITSESCDDYGIHRFPKKPSDAELEAYLRNLYPGDFPN